MKAYRKISQIMTLSGAYHKDGRNLTETDLGLISLAAIIFDDSQIIWVGKDSEFPAQYENIPSENLENKVLLPGLVDSHTHLVFGGDRSHEYAMRLRGASYEEIAKSGGGILNTMNATLASSADELFHIACERVERLYSYGIDTIEIKSGYGLTYDKELEISFVIDRLKKHFFPKVQIFSTFLAAHAVPKSFASSSEYMKKVVLPLLEKIAELKIVDAADIFHEQNYFSEDDVHELIKKAEFLKIPLKIHADEFNDNNGASIASQNSFLSCDHLLATGEHGIEQLSKSSTVATLLPGTAFFLGKKLADGRKFLDRGVKVAIASDYNPGSCHFDNLLMVASLAAPQYKMNLAELWCSITLNAAHSLGYKNQRAIVRGFKPRFSIFNVKNIELLTYSWGRNFSVNFNK